MPKYSLFRFERQSGHAHTETFSASDDNDAKRKTLERVGSDDYELWFDRKVIAVRTSTE
jgi:hypothetical protein